MPHISEIRAFSKPLQANLAKLGITSTQNLLLHLPLRYIDETKITAINALRVGESAQVEGEIVHAEVSYKPRKALIVRLEDATGQLTLRFLNFYPSQIATLNIGSQHRVFGEVRHGYFGYEMVHPTRKRVDRCAEIAKTLTPIYSTVAGLTQHSLRKAILLAFKYENMAETLPLKVYQHPNLPELPSFTNSLHALHYPAPHANITSLENKVTLEYQRLAFDELLAHQLSMRKHYAKRKSGLAPQFSPSKRLVSALLKQLPFALTSAQQKVALEIESDLTQAHPMQRLLQGDVGSGKTIVACMAALQAIENGWQVALMAPTEILAEQHYRKIHSWLAPLQIQSSWLTGSQNKKEREIAIHHIAQGEAQLAIGTHALFQEAVKFKHLGLVIIDEQHRFGVQQRLALRQKGEPEPHQLMMTATPIPRTLSMSYYADLDVSVIDELPPGRAPVITKLVSDQRRDEILQRVREACQQGQQAYWVCPLIEESEALQLVTANDTYVLMQVTFPELSIGLVHGRMKSAEKQVVMTEFSAGRIQLLVATTVIEVGVDVPNASLMVIEHAERMGLSQLHQLRGRVGRGAAKSTCILLYQTKLSESARARLKIIFESNDGFAIAQSDLSIRGPGELLGLKQSGVPMLKIADLNRDESLLETASQVADQILEHYPAAAQAHLLRWMPNSENFIKV